MLYNIKKDHYHDHVLSTLNVLIKYLKYLDFSTFVSGVYSMRT